MSIHSHLNRVAAFLNLIDANEIHQLILLEMGKKENCEYEIPNIIISVITKCV